MSIILFNYIKFNRIRLTNKKKTLNRNHKSKQTVIRQCIIEITYIILKNNCVTCSDICNIGNYVMLVLGHSPLDLNDISKPIKLTMMEELLSNELSSS